MKPILLFDIDGTLLHVRKKFLHEVIHQILKEFKLTSVSLKNRSFAGRTDRDIFSELILEHSQTDDLYDSISSRYISLMTENLSATDVEAIDGIFGMIEFAQKHDLHIGLCTGNYREVAQAKVEAIGLEGTFLFGGYGCNHHDRIHLPKLAKLEYQDVFKRTARAEDFIIIGDTPNDIRCARHFGARVIAVTTGSFSFDQLTDHKPDLILDSLEEPDKWMPKFTTTNQK
ncbi:HAD family hydrolase [Rhodohalobacter barkolensis]|uniref:phosphoglycolate phosphatase n=1 Tax=Rhodohalobacter barkolensis TaxID=2053187 RepID=A0A2N0VEC4_9BACT|nr:HAD hydrolase-like protein [Rhodohalobacter barkolensis]PKD42542.1 hypothetical protein CWD77_14105 [Rhodohalobacter barkolensis]